MPGPYADYLLAVTRPTEGDRGWTYAIDGEHVGPFPTRELAAADRHARFGRWNQSARARGGWMWLATTVRWGLVLPVGVECRAPRMESEACTRH